MADNLFFIFPQFLLLLIKDDESALRISINCETETDLINLIKKVFIKISFELHKKAFSVRWNLKKA